MKLLISILTVLISATCFGFVLMMYWGWFVSPLGVPVIGFFHAIGLYYMVQLLKVKKKLDLTDSSIESDLISIRDHVSIALVFLLMGYLITLVG